MNHNERLTEQDKALKKAEQEIKAIQHKNKANRERWAKDREKLKKTMRSALIFHCTACALVVVFNVFIALKYMGVL